MAGPVEQAVRRSVTAATLCGRLHGDVHAAGIELALATARTVDSASEPGQLGYLAAVLSKQMQLLGLDAKSTDRWLRGASRRELEELERQVAERLASAPALRAVEG